MDGQEHTESEFVTNDSHFTISNRGVRTNTLRIFKVIHRHDGYVWVESNNCPFSADGPLTFKESDVRPLTAEEVIWAL